MNLHRLRPPPIRLASRAAVTLLEATIGLSIIAVLAILIFPLYQRSTAVRDQITCTANLRSLGTASLLYMADRRGELFPSKNWHGHREGILNYLDENLSGSPMKDTVFTCPAFKKLRSELFPSSLNRTYVLNYHALKYNPASTYAHLPLEQRPLLPLPHRLSQIAEPRRMWMICDGAPNVGTVLQDRPATLETLVTPHGSNINVVFFDGHVEAIAKEAFNPADNAFWKGNQ